MSGSGTIVKLVLSANKQRSLDDAVGHSSVGSTPKAVNDPSEVDGGSALSDIGISSVVRRQMGKWLTVMASMQRCQAIAAADQRVSADAKIARPSNASRERRADIHGALLKLGCCLIHWNTLRRTEHPLRIRAVGTG